MTNEQLDIEAFITQKINEVMGASSNATPTASPPTFEDALATVDPADSEAALAMLDWLLKTQRLGRVGVLDGGQGYLFVYAEPKGSSKAGYRPGATQGDRIVDEALDKQRASGAEASKLAVCRHCLDVVAERNGVLFLDDPDNPSTSCVNSPDGVHHAA